MDEDISIINNETRKEKIINFFLNNKKKLISIIAILVLTPLSFYSYQIYKAGNKEQLADKYNSAVINYENGDKSKVSKIMKEIINDKDQTYSPLALYFLIDNEVSVSSEEINELFDIVINDVKLDKEIRNLVIYKKGLFNSALLLVLEKYEKIKEIVLPTLGKERQKTYSPFLPVCPETGHVLEVPIIEIKKKKEKLFIKMAIKK